MTAEIKKAVSIPVIAQGRLQDPEVAEKVLADGKADFVAIGRGWIAEPDWVNKVKAGDLEGMRRCISCDHCIGDRISGNMTIRCTLNAMAGREHRFLNGYPKAEIKKTVAVIGAGPAGLEAIYRLAMRGHTVDLYDKADGLCGGSQMKSASTPPCKDNLKNIPNFYAAQFKRFDNIRIHLGVEITKDNLDEIKADAVILATGAVPIVPPIPGLRENKKVLTANREFDIEFDTLINALGKKPLADLEAPIREKFDQCIVIGDALQRSNICTGIEDGFFAALKV